MHHRDLSFPIGRKISTGVECSRCLFKCGYKYAADRISVGFCSGSGVLFSYSQSTIATLGSRQLDNHNGYDATFCAEFEVLVSI